MISYLVLSTTILPAKAEAVPSALTVTVAGKLNGLVIPLMVKLPDTVTLAPLPATLVITKVEVGNLATPKKSSAFK
ncbi:hypothetical protein D3C73_1410950 [compost metagenome]